VSEQTLALPAPDLRAWLRSAKTAAKTCVVILAVIGAAHVTEPLRAEAAPAAVVKSVEGAGAGKG